MICDYSAGLLAGIVAVLIGHPLDTVKAQQQLRSITFREAAKRISRHRGWKGYYRGLSAPLLASGALNAIFFGIYGDCREYLIQRRTRTNTDHLPTQSYVVGSKNSSDYDSKNKNSMESTYADIFISGTVAGMATLVILTPVELIKTKLQCQMKRKTFHGSVDCFQKITKEAGFKGLYRGFVPLSIRDGIGGGAYFVAYEFIKQIMGNVYGKTSTSTEGIIAGGLAGISNWTVFLPFDTIKTRMQGDDHIKPHYRSMFQVAKELHRAKGLRGLYSGFWSVSARAFPVNAAIFFVYEFVLNNVCSSSK